MEFETDIMRGTMSSSAGVAELLKTLDPQRNTRAILSTGPQDYIQTGAYANGYVIEKRSGSEETHVHARHAQGRPPLAAPEPMKQGWFSRLLGLAPESGSHEHAFTLNEVTQVFEAYVDAAPYPQFVSWHSGYS